MITIDVRHKIDFWKGGLELDTVIERFAFRSGMRGTAHNNHPTKIKFEFVAENRTQIYNFKRRVKRRSVLKDAGVSINIIDEKIL